MSWIIPVYDLGSGSFGLHESFDIDSTLSSNRKHSIQVDWYRDTCTSLSPELQSNRRSCCEFVRIADSKSHFIARDIFRIPKVFVHRGYVICLIRTSAVRVVTCTLQKASRQGARRCCVEQFRRAHTYIAALLIIEIASERLVASSRCLILSNVSQDQGIELVVRTSH